MPAASNNAPCRPNLIAARNDIGAGLALALVRGRPRRSAAVLFVEFAVVITAAEAKDFIDVLKARADLKADAELEARLVKLESEANP
jgi:hypothetical protein